MIPPGFGHHTADCEYPSWLDELWAGRNVRAYGAVKVMGESLNVVGRVVDSKRVVLAAYPSDDITPIPNWTALLVRMAKSGFPEDIDGDDIESSIEKLAVWIDSSYDRTNEYSVMEGQVFPKDVVFFRGKGKWAEYPQYPSDIVKYTAHAVPGASLAPQSLNMSLGKVHELAIKKFLLGSSVPDVELLVVEDGMSFLDANKNEGYMVGESRESQILRLVGSKSRSVFVFVNLVLIIGIAVMLILRQRAKAKAE